MFGYKSLYIQLGMANGIHSAWRKANYRVLWWRINWRSMSLILASLRGRSTDTHTDVVPLTLLAQRDRVKMWMFFWYRPTWVVLDKWPLNRLFVFPAFTPSRYPRKALGEVEKKHLLTAYFLYNNTSGKNYQNQFTYTKVTARQIITFFETRCRLMAKN